MTSAMVALVAIGAALGAVGRYRVGRFISERTESDFPWGTWVVNAMGTLLLGVFYYELDKLHVYVNWWALLGTGFCGAFTTFSTMSVEAVGLFRRRPLLCILYVGSSFAVGLVFAVATQWI